MISKFYEKNEKGFTLIELMIVIAIIGILAAIAIPQFSQYRKKGFVTTLKSDAKNAQTAAAAYLADNPSATGLTVANLTASGYTRSTSIPADPTISFTSASAYTITVTGNTAWGLTGNTAVIDQNGQFTTEPAI